jgi:ribosome-associated toxin RatA of RatAB toxin-antitoxin module
MHHVYREATVPFSREKMFNLVNQVNDYPKFLPWCKSARILSQSPSSMKATLVLSKGGIQKAFTTLNTLTPFESIKIDLIDGPFKHLAGMWHFKHLSDHSCKVSVDLEFEFAGRLIEIMLGPVFSQIAQSLVDAFCQEAKQRFEELT